VQQKRTRDHDGAHVLIQRGAADDHVRTGGRHWFRADHRERGYELQLDRDQQRIVHHIHDRKRNWKRYGRVHRGGQYRR